MKTLGRFQGVPIRLHYSALVIIAAVASATLFGAETWSSGFVLAVRDAAALTCVFGLVTLHEIGHTYEAMRRGLMVDSITIWLFGGVVQMDLEKSFLTPTDEFWISIAGPAVNFFLCVLAAPLVLLAGEETLVRQAATIFVAINGMLLVFNLFPAFPMDGGRILRSLLSMVMDNHSAQQYTSYVACAVGAFFVAFGAWNFHIILFIIGLGVIAINVNQVRNDSTTRVT